MPPQCSRCAQNAGVLPNSRSSVRRRSTTLVLDDAEWTGHLSKNRYDQQLTSQDVLVSYVNDENRQGLDAEVDLQLTVVPIHK